MYKIPFYLWTDGYCRSCGYVRADRRRSEETTNTVFLSEHCQGLFFFLQIHIFLRVKTYSAVHPVHSAQSQSTNMCVLSE